MVIDRPTLYCLLAFVVGMAIYFGITMVIADRLFRWCSNASDPAAFRIDGWMAAMIIIGVVGAFAMLVTAPTERLQMTAWYLSMGFAAKLLLVLLAESPRTAKGMRVAIAATGYGIGLIGGSVAFVYAGLILVDLLRLVAAAAA